MAPLSTVDAWTASEIPAALQQPRSRADRAFRFVLAACASSVLLAVVAIVGFLVAHASTAWHYQGMKLLTSQAWVPRGAHPSFGFAGELVGSVIIAVVAIIVALPLSIATALAINELVPLGLRRPLTTLVDLLAALPSLVYGLWARSFLDGHLFLTTKWLGRHAAFFPPFRSGGASYGHSLFEAGLVVAVMILPIITSITREVMSQVPRDTCEAALALGGTRWGMITDVILPFSRDGIIGGAMLGIGRALGETIAVSLVLLGNAGVVWTHILQNGGDSVSALIVREFFGSSTLLQSALMFAGLALFVVTLGVNLAARAIVARSARKFAR